MLIWVWDERAMYPDSGRDRHITADKRKRHVWHVAWLGKRKGDPVLICLCHNVKMRDCKMSVSATQYTTLLSNFLMDWDHTLLTGSNLFIRGQRPRVYWPFFSNNFCETRRQIWSSRLQFWRLTAFWQWGEEHILERRFIFWPCS